MLLLFSQLKKRLKEGNLTIVHLLVLAYLYSMCFLYAIEKTNHLSLGDTFPTSSDFFIFLNMFIWLLLFSSVVAKKSMDFLPFILGSILGLAFECASFLSIHLTKTSTSSDLAITIIAISVGGIGVTLIGSYLLSAIFKKELTDETKELSLEKDTADVQDVPYLDLPNYECIVDSEVKEAVLDIYSAYNSLTKHIYSNDDYEGVTKHSLSIQEHHALTKSRDQLYAIMNEFVSLQEEHQQKMKPTLLAVLSDIEQEATDILEKKEHERMAAIERISFLRKEKTTY